MTPLDLLKNQLTEYEKALQKSKYAFDLDLINDKTHSRHVINLLPKIEMYRKAILILETYGI